MAAGIDAAQGWTVRPLASGDHGRVLAMATDAGFDLDLAAEAARPWAELWIAERPAQTPSAYALFWRVADELELLQLATHLDVRRQGAARGLLEAVLGAAAARGISALFLEVRAKNDAARRLYEGLGFEQTRVRRGYYSDGEDAVEMRHSVG